MWIIYHVYNGYYEYHLYSPAMWIDSLLDLQHGPVTVVES